MSNWTREAVRKKAIRAAAKLALAGTLACGTDMPGESLETIEGVVPPPPTTDSVSVEQPQPVVEAEHVVRRDGTIQVVVRDCSALRDSTAENWWEAYSACCDAI